MKIETHDVLLLLGGMHNTRLIQHNITEWNTELFDEKSNYPWDESLFELYVSVLERLYENRNK